MRFQFTTIDLLVAVMAVACGAWLSMIEPEFWSGYEPTWFSAVLVTGNLLFAIVLWQETCTIRDARTKATDETEIARSSLSFHLTFRYLLLLVIVVAQAAIAAFAARSFFDTNFAGRSTPTSARFFDSQIWLARGVMLLPWLLATLLARHRPNHASVGRGRNHVVNGVAWPFAIFLAALLLLLFNWTFIVLLVDTSIKGMESSQAPHSGLYNGLNPLPSVRTDRFAFLTLLSSVPIAVWATMLSVAAYRWRRGRTARVPMCLAILALAVMAVYPVWFFSGGLRQMSPPFAESLNGLNTCSIVCAIGLLLMLSGYSTWISFEHSETVLRSTRSQLRRCCAVLFFVGVLGILVVELWNGLFFWSPLEAVWHSFLGPTGKLLLWVVGFVAVANVIKRPQTAELRLTILPTSRLRTFWLILFAGMLFAIPPLTWLGYAVVWTASLR